MSGHVPVLLDEVIANLSAAGWRLLPRRHVRRRRLCPGDSRGCATARYGRSTATRRRSQRGAGLVARFPGRLHLLQGQFGDMLALLDAAGVAALDGVVLDLGVSSFQIDDPARGFSFRADGPLDMRMGKHGTTAADLVNTLSEAGAGRRAVRVRRGACLPPHRPGDRGGAAWRRRSRPPAGWPPSSASVLPPDRSGIDPATRSFQALRIKVNDELAADRAGAGAGGSGCCRRAAGWSWWRSIAWRTASSSAS